MTKKIYKTRKLECPSCAKMIELDLEDIGVKGKCNYIKSEVEVIFDDRKITEEQIIKTINNT